MITRTDILSDLERVADNMVKTSADLEAYIDEAHEEGNMVAAAEARGAAFLCKEFSRTLRELMAKWASA